MWSCIAGRSSASRASLWSQKECWRCLTERQRWRVLQARKSDCWLYKRNSYGLIKSCQLKHSLVFVVDEEFNSCDVVIVPAVVLG